MSVLSGIKESVQQVAEAISIAVGLEVEIVDNKLRILGGTGYYHRRIGKKEEDGNLEGNYLYARVLRTGKTQYVEAVSYTHLDVYKRQKADIFSLIHCKAHI